MDSASSREWVSDRTPAQLCCLHTSSVRLSCLSGGLLARAGIQPGLRSRKS
jgi:hypothetical protein